MQVVDYRRIECMAELQLRIKVVTELTAWQPQTATPSSTALADRQCQTSAKIPSTDSQATATVGHGGLPLQSAASEGLAPEVLGAGLPCHVATRGTVPSRRLSGCFRGVPEVSVGPGSLPPSPTSPSRFQLPDGHSLAEKLGDPACLASFVKYPMPLARVFLHTVSRRRKNSGCLQSRAR